MGKGKPFIPRQRGERGGHKGGTLRDKRSAANRERAQLEALCAPLSATLGDVRPGGEGK